jgi:hypothetical protein
MMLSGVWQSVAAACPRRHDRFLGVIGNVPRDDGRQQSAALILQVLVRNLPQLKRDRREVRATELALPVQLDTAAVISGG